MYQFDNGVNGSEEEERGFTRINVWNGKTNIIPGMRMMGMEGDAVYTWTWGFLVSCEGETEDVAAEGNGIRKAFFIQIFI